MPQWEDNVLRLRKLESKGASEQENKGMKRQTESLRLLALSLALLLFFARSGQATKYYLAPAVLGGSDGNNGSQGAPWASPNHALNCGDEIIATESTAYDANNFIFNKWGPVNCSGHGVAWLKCNTFDACKIIGASGSGGMVVTASHWGIMGWEVVNQIFNNQACFQTYVSSTGTNLTDIIFANDIANGCHAGGFTIASDGNVSADYVTAIADIAYNAAQTTGACTSGFNFIGPYQWDTAPGTHLYISQSFAWANVDPNPCAVPPTPPTDGEGFIFDTLDQFHYTQQAVMENNIGLYNGARAFAAVQTTQARVIFQNNTGYGDGTSNALPHDDCGEFLDYANGNDITYQFNVGETINPLSCGTNFHQYCFVGKSPTGTADYDLCYSPYGYNDEYLNGFAFGSHNAFGTNPVFASPPSSVPGPPNCAGKANVIDCMAPIINGLKVQQGNSWSSWGYQPVSNTPVNDPLFPQWLCNVNLPAGLVSMACGSTPPPPPPSNPSLLWWKFDDGSGSTALDSSGNGDNGTLTGGYSWTPGVLAGAISFDGSSGYMYSASQLAGPQVFTTALWFKTTTASGGKLIGLGDVQNGPSASYDRNLYMNNSGQLYFGVYTNATQMTINSPNAYNDGHWHHAAATLAGDGMMLYVDGNLVASNAGVTSAQVFNGYWKIGYDNLAYWPSVPTSFFFNGAIDDARVYNRELSSTEVAGLYSAASTYSPCDVNGDGTVNVADVQGEVNQALGISTCKNDINLDGQCNVIDVQRVVNAAMGGQCVTTP